MHVKLCYTGLWTRLNILPLLRGLTCRLFCLSSVQEESLFSEEPDTPLRRPGSKVRHMTGSGWALTWLSLVLWVTSHSIREPSSYPATRRGPGPESGWERGAGVAIRERRKDGEVGRERKDKEECVRAASSRKTTGTSARCRGYHAGSCCWHSEGRCGFHSSARCASSLDLYYGTPHFAPHPYHRATGLAARTTRKVK